MRRYVGGAWGAVWPLKMRTGQIMRAHKEATCDVALLLFFLTYLGTRIYDVLHELPQQQKKGGGV